jgi:hypothetical protein
MIHKLLVLLGVIVLGLFAASSARTEGTTRTVLDVTGSVEVHNCTQEPFVESGTILVLSHEFVDASGTAHMNFEFIFQGVTATSLSTGAQYHLTGTTTFNLVVGRGADVLTSVGTRFILGSDPDLMHHVVVHATNSPSGDLVVTFEKGFLECVVH